MRDGKRLTDYPNAAERQKLIRFVVVGVAVNLSAYVIYLALLAFRVGPMISMTIGFFGALTLSFALNRAWTFQHRAHWRRAVWKYATLYVGMYIAQALLLDWAVRAGLNLALFQFVVTCGMATLSFLVQRLWVFTERPPSA